MPDFAEEEKLVQLSGSGGGGKGGGDRKPEEEDDNLFSRAEATVLLAIAEGPVEGFAESEKQSVYLNDTPIENEKGDANFDGNIEIDFKSGKIDQSSIKDFDEVRIEQSVGIQCVEGISVPVTTTTNNLQKIVVRVGVSALYKVDDDNGDISGTKVKFDINITDALGAQLYNEGLMIEGKTRGSYDEEYEFDIASNTTGPWTVSVTRTTEDPDSVTDANDLFFKAIVGVLEETFRYPGTALLGLKFPSETFSSVPSVSVDLRGLKIKVPNNRTEDLDGDVSYSGTWNGGFSTEKYCTNPAWIFYDLLTTNRYGCGVMRNNSNDEVGPGIREEDIDKYALFEIGKYCDELVDDGRGGKERRFTFNGYINNRGEAYQVLNSIAACFRGMLYFAGGGVVATQDKPGDVVKVFSRSNVIEEIGSDGVVTTPAFNYEGTSRKARKTVALVSWNDPEDRYKTKLEYVEDSQAIENFGYKELEVRAFGCTSRGQAQRMGRWALVTNLTEKETVTFRVSAEGFFMMPGELIEIRDEAKSARIVAGRVREGSTASTILVDTYSTLANGVAYEVTIGDQTLGVAESQTRSQSTEAQPKIIPSSAFSQAPSAGDPFLLREQNGAKPRTYRVIGIMEGDDGTVTVTGTQYNADKYDTVDLGTFFDSGIASVASVTVTPTVDKGTIKLETS
tara:strand:+ start:2128 stop:4161 length:2034 start_codon:yes stop_codon:yes gene_type:complete